MPYVDRGTYPLTHANQPRCAPLIRLLATDAHEPAATPVSRNVSYSVPHSDVATAAASIATAVDRTAAAVASSAA